MILIEWLKLQGFPHGMECVGVERLQQLWDASKHEEREACAKICDEIEYDYYRDSKCATAIRKRSNV